MTKALVVLGGGINPDGTLRPPSMCRVELAIKLYFESNFNYVIPSSRYSYQIAFTPKSTIALEMKKKFLEAKIPADKIILEDQSKDTLTNILFVKKILISKDIKDITIVTSLFQEEKVSYLCKKILGPQYKDKVKFAISDDGLSGGDLMKQIKIEKEALEKYKKIFGLIKEGDDAMISQVLYNNKHPNFTNNPSVFWYTSTLSSFHESQMTSGIKIRSAL